MVRVVLVVTLAAVVGLAACSEDREATVSSATTTTTQRPPIDELAPTCEEWLIRPVTADEVQWGCAVSLDGPVTQVQAGMAVVECDDGEVLFFGDQGWGYVGQPMRLPDAPALRSAQDACPVELPPMLAPPPASS